jgi:DNA-binding beta-propeller fold protein YncE
MNSKFMLSVLVSFASIRLLAADDANTTFEQGLLEEEANHKLDAAIHNYRDSLSYLVTNRQMLATAVFRLGECYRKAGKVGEARMQYRRILRDFPDQTNLVRISEEMVGAATNPPPAFVLAFGNSNANPANNLGFPGGIAVDASGFVYVSDTHNNRIQKFTARGDYITQWGAKGTAAGFFDYPQGLAADRNGHIYVADTHNHRIQKFNEDGTFIAQWGKLGSKPGEFNAPYSIAIDPAGNLLVIEAHNFRVQKLSSTGLPIGQFGTNGSGPGQFDLPKSVAVDQAGNIYVADTRNKRIQKFTAEGSYSEEWGTYGKAPGQFDQPHDVALDPWGNIYVADADGPDHNNRIQLFFNDQILAATWGSFGGGPGQFNFAARIAIDPSGLNIYVCDAGNNRVELFSYSNQ